MRSQPFDVKTEESPTRSRRLKSQLAKRAEVLRAIGLEALEPRTLLATHPATLPTTVTSPVVDISGQPTLTSNESTPSIAVDPNDSQKLAAIWTRNDPSLAPGQTEIVQAAYSVDGGASWNQINVGNFIVDPSSSPTAPVPYEAESNASVAFDRNDNVYFMVDQHKLDNSYGALLLTKYNMSKTTPSQVYSNHIVVQWDPSSEDFNPTMAVDQNLASFSDVDSNGVTRTQNDPNSGNVYVAYSTVTTAPAGNPAGVFFNPNSVQVVMSGDGGTTFSSFDLANDNGFSGSARDNWPAIAISQGSAARPAGTLGTSDPGAPAISPGEVSVTFDDFGSLSTNSPPYTELLDNRIIGADVTKSFSATPGIIQVGTPTPVTPVTTNFPVNVNITNSNFSVSNLTVTLGILHPTLAGVSATLIPPTGSGLASITLFTNQENSAGTSNANIGISGAQSWDRPRRRDARHGLHRLRRARHR